MKTVYVLELETSMDDQQVIGVFLDPEHAVETVRIRLGEHNDQAGREMALRAMSGEIEGAYYHLTSYPLQEEPMHAEQECGERFYWNRATLDTLLASHS